MSLSDYKTVTANLSPELKAKFDTIIEAELVDSRTATPLYEQLTGPESLLYTRYLLSEIKSGNLELAINQTAQQPDDNEIAPNTKTKKRFCTIS